MSFIMGYAGEKTDIDVAEGAAQESPYVADLSFFSSIFQNKSHFDKYGCQNVCLPSVHDPATIGRVTLRGG